MSIYKGTQLIAANGAPGQNGTNGTDGQNGAGIMIVHTNTELHNNIDENGVINIVNQAPNSSQWCNVEGYNCEITSSSGQGSQVRGFNVSMNGGQGCQVEGNGVYVSGNLSQGVHIEGNYVKVNSVSNGTHIEGYHHGGTYGTYPDEFNVELSSNKQGLHIEGACHNGVYVQSIGGHQGGKGLGEYDYQGNYTAPTMLVMPPQRGSTSDLIEVIGGGDGEGRNLAIRQMDEWGNMAINGDLAFTALSGSNQVIGQYTLGEIVEALIRVGILNPPL